jgi:hypothetical protein
MPLLDEYLTEEEAAAELRRSKRTLSLWRTARTGPPFIKIAGINGQVLYRRSSVLRWLEQQEVQPVRERRRIPQTA